MAAFTIAELKRSLRIEHNDDDALLQDIVTQASAMVAAHMEVTEVSLIATTVHNEVKQAAIIIGTRMYEYPEGLDHNGREVVWLSDNVIRMLDPHTKPVLA